MGEINSSELFTKLMHRQGEDYFTECVAFTLREDSELAESFLVHLCGEILEGTPIRGASITIETQKTFPGSCLEVDFQRTHPEFACDSCVDMVFRLNDCKPIGIENKLGASEGKGQLLRYLALPLARVAFITPDYLEISEEVLAHPKYVRPRDGRKHFLWSDFFQIIENSVRKPSSPVLNRALLGLFKNYGFEPPIPEIGDLNDPDITKRKRNRENFKKLWELSRSRLEQRGWKRMQYDNIACLWCDSGPAERVEQFYVNTLKPGSLLIRLTPRGPGELVKLEQSLLKPDSTISGYSIILERRDMTRVKPQLGEQIVTVLEVSTALNRLFAGCEGVDAKKERLSDYLLAVLDQAEAKCPEQAAA